jgi:hypothetical protein
MLFIRWVSVGLSVWVSACLTKRFQDSSYEITAPTHHFMTRNQLQKASFKYSHGRHSQEKSIQWDSAVPAVAEGYESIDSGLRPFTGPNLLQKGHRFRPSVVAVTSSVADSMARKVVCCGQRMDDICQPACKGELARLHTV